jgi:excisionase family DNA binding protein
MPDEEYITVTQAAQIAGLTTRHIRWLLQQGVLQGIKPGHDWLLKRSAVMDYLRQDRKPGPRAKDRKRES